MPVVPEGKCRGRHAADHRLQNHAARRRIKVCMGRLRHDQCHDQGNQQTGSMLRHSSRSPGTLPATPGESSVKTNRSGAFRQAIQTAPARQTGLRLARPTAPLSGTRAGSHESIYRAPRSPTRSRRVQHRGHPDRGAAPCSGRFVRRHPACPATVFPAHRDRQPDRRPRVGPRPAARRRRAGQHVRRSSSPGPDRGRFPGRHHGRRRTLPCWRTTGPAGSDRRGGGWLRALQPEGSTTRRRRTAGDRTEPWRHADRARRRRGRRSGLRRFRDDPQPRSRRVAPLVSADDGRNRCRRQVPLRSPPFRPVDCIRLQSGGRFEPGRGSPHPPAGGRRSGDRTRPADCRRRGRGHRHGSQRRPRGERRSHDHRPRRKRRCVAHAIGAVVAARCGSAWPV